ncbi:hypothetical protein [Ensifer canadensis]
MSVIALHPKQPQEANDAPAALRAPSPASPAIPLAFSLRSIIKRFGDKTVLDGIDLDVPQGQFVAVIGKSGCGLPSIVVAWKPRSRNSGAPASVNSAGSPALGAQSPGLRRYLRQFLFLSMALPVLPHSATIEIAASIKARICDQWIAAPAPAARQNAKIVRQIQQIRRYLTQTD